jgi:hypothetical protein
MYRFQIYVGKGNGWKIGRNLYTAEEIATRAVALDKVGIKYRIMSESLLHKTK